MFHDADELAGDFSSGGRPRALRTHRAGPFN